jgi:signal transduction histidine kinase
MEPRVFDGLLTVALTVLCVGSQFYEAADEVQDFRDTDALGVALGLLICLPLYWRRVRPLPALLVSTVGITVLAALDYRTNNLPLAVMFLTFAVGAYAPRVQAWVGLAVVNAAILLILLTNPPDLDVTGMLLNLAIFTGTWMAGQVVRSRTATTAARVAEAEERAEAQRQISARSVAEERLRLAQELHDVVAHSMSVIAVQAGMGAHVIDTRPADAKAALEAISTTSRSTLAEMRRLLGVLRDEDGDLDHSPAPGVDELPRLVDDVRAAGVPVDLTIEGDRSCVPKGLDLSVYRVVQEGLTNVIKHAGPARAVVTVRYEPTAVDVAVVDDGRGAAAVPAAATVDGRGDPTGASRTATASTSGAGDVPGGHGLLGMRERVALWGGTLDAGPEPGGGFGVRAHLPYGEPT